MGTGNTGAKAPLIIIFLMHLIVGCRHWPDCLPKWVDERFARSQALKMKSGEFHYDLTEKHTVRRKGISAFKLKFERRIGRTLSRWRGHLVDGHHPRGHSNFLHLLGPIQNSAVPAPHQTRVPHKGFQVLEPRLLLLAYDIDKRLETSWFRAGVIGSSF
jgi:hypothetical protein